MTRDPQILMFPAKREARPPRPKSRRWLTVVLTVYWLAMLTGTHWPKLPRITEKNGFDKVMHFGAYAGLAMLLAAVLAGRRISPGQLIVRIVALLAVVGAIDEITQPLVGRDCELFDWCADVTGALVGSSILIAATWLRRLRTASAWDRAA